jgi:ribosome recycling factor
MVKTVEHLKHELGSLRAGRANPQILDRIMVNYYGTPTPLNQVGNISAPEPRILVISPWDPSVIHEIEKSIQASDLGINPMNDGKIIRLVIPELTEERRKTLVKTLHKMAEDSKVALRTERHDSLENIKKMEKNSEITEDDMKRDEKDIQKIIDKYTKSIDDLVREKEKEIMGA